MRKGVLIVISGFSGAGKGTITKKLLENYETVMEAINKAKPAAAKGQYIRSVAVSTTMGPSVFVK